MSRGLRQVLKAFKPETLKNAKLTLELKMTDNDFTWRFEDESGLRAYFARTGELEQLWYCAENARFDLTYRNGMYSGFTSFPMSEKSSIFQQNVARAKCLVGGAKFAEALRTAALEAIEVRVK